MTFKKRRALLLDPRKPYQKGRKTRFVFLCPKSTIHVCLLLAVIFFITSVIIIYNLVSSDKNEFLRSGTMSSRKVKDKHMMYRSKEEMNALKTQEDGVTLPAPARPSNPIAKRHPCEGFTSSPNLIVDPKRTGHRSCEVCYIDVDQAVESMPSMPTESLKLKNLTYYHSNNRSPVKQLANGIQLDGSDFGGYHSLLYRDLSYDVQKSMIIHCGFRQGPRPGLGPGFTINYEDITETDKCDKVVVSAIFGEFDKLHQPQNISERAKKDFCFIMFVDKNTASAIKKAENIDKTENTVGLWRLIVVDNLPYKDPRRNGKIPKLLAHRLFREARYSIWIDGKLILTRDPYQLLERFLWRQNASFAISKHYERFDVFVEAEHNKFMGKYDNASIDFQLNFYKQEGMTPFSKDKYPITSDVPEGCVIIREHTPISNLFACNWFNEVDRFTSRDQLSFSTVRDKIMSQVDFKLHMFEDCERRNFVEQKPHIPDMKEKEKLNSSAKKPPPPPVNKPSPPHVDKPPPTPVVPKESTPTQRPSEKNEKDRKRGSRHHRSRHRH